MPGLAPLPPLLPATGRASSAPLPTVGTAASPLGEGLHISAQTPLSMWLHGRVSATAASGPGGALQPWRLTHLQFLVCRLREDGWTPQLPSQLPVEGGD